MAAQTQLAFIQAEIEARLATLRETADWYRRRAFFSQMIVAVLSACVAIVTGLKSVLIPIDATNTALVLSSLVSVIATWTAFSSPRELWQLNMSTYTGLRALQSRLAFFVCASGFKDKETEIVFQAFSDYQSLLAAHNKDWVTVRKK